MSSKKEKKQHFNEITKEWEDCITCEYGEDTVRHDFGVKRRYLRKADLDYYGIQESSLNVSLQERVQCSTSGHCLYFAGMSGSLDHFECFCGSRHGWISIDQGTHGTAA